MLSIEPSEIICKSLTLSVWGCEFLAVEETTYWTPDLLPLFLRDFFSNFAKTLFFYSFTGSNVAESSLSSMVYLVSITEKKEPLSLKLGRIFYGTAMLNGLDGSGSGTKIFYALTSTFTGGNVELCWLNSVFAGLVLIASKVFWSF